MGLLYTCCSYQGDEKDEVKLSQITKHEKSGTSIKEFPLDDTARTNDVSGIGESSSVAKTSGRNKKILQYKMFKSLRGTHNIAANFVTGKQLGKGSFGEVRECLNKATNMTLAMKIVDKSHIGQHQVLVDLMEQELEVLYNTDHPHIVRVMELLEDEAKFYIVSELVTGGELYDYIIKKKRLSERQAASIIKQILLALNYMHQQNIVHRDIKPENILLSPEESTSGEDIQVKLTDFGFATFFKKGEGLKQVLGSPLYMAPEIVQEQAYDAKVDIWSVGVIAHIMLSGRPPFFGKSKQEIYNAIVNKKPDFGRVLDSLSPEAIQFTMKCLKKDPQMRASAQQLLLHPWLADNTEENELDYDVTDEIISDMAAFRKQNRFQSGVVSLLSHMKLYASELVNLKQMFIKYDTSKDGFLSLDELREGMTEVLGTLKAQTADWSELIDYLDTNGDGKIDYGEFITAAVNRQKLLNEQNIKLAFEIFDRDGSGEISIQELKETFHGLGDDLENDAMFKQIMQEVDKNNDQSISMREFNETMIAVIAQRSSNL